ncbi:MAG: hypothetical protein KGN01_05930 [Patescibacteria group bacterium]|nr:hypothetical protein [Patescibacteria group bacterium]
MRELLDKCLKINVGWDGSQQTPKISSSRAMSRLYLKACLYAAVNYNRDYIDTTILIP